MWIANRKRSQTPCMCIRFILYWVSRCMYACINIPNGYVLQINCVCVRASLIRINWWDSVCVQRTSEIEYVKCVNTMATPTVVWCLRYSCVNRHCVEAFREKSFAGWYLWISVLVKWVHVENDLDNMIFIRN